ncbi:MAG: hypothetical protein MJ232_04630 [archaeon]|nr:hypothetical protein [archaeon]
MKQSIHILIKDNIVGYHFKRAYEELLIERGFTKYDGINPIYVFTTTSNDTATDMAIFLVKFNFEFRIMHDYLTPVYERDKNYER